MSRTPTHAVPAQNSRVLVLTALITATTTVAVAFIGIFPQIRNNDAQTIQRLQDGMTELQNKLRQGADGPPPSQEKKMSVTGTVWTPDRKHAMPGVEVYLLPEGNNYLTAKTDDNGNFTLNGVPDGMYSIIVRESSGQSGKGLLDDAADEVSVIGAAIKYRIRK
jgi:Carboxypeptidase regulatory-like domain